MKQLTPTWEWIGVLIGIVVLGSILGRVTALGTKCYPEANGVTDPDEMTSIMDASKKAARTCQAPNAKCLQYVPPATDGIKLQLTIECGPNCPASQAEINKKFLNDGYTCSDTCNEGTSCKALADIKLTTGKDCYDYPKGKKLLKGETLPKKISCVGGCFSLDYNKDTRSGTDTGLGVFMGCKVDCEKVKSNTLVITDTNTCTKCDNLDTQCKPKLIMEMGCWEPTKTALTSVKLITEAMSNAKSHDCGSGKQCLLYTPPTDSKNRKGKVHFMIKCSTSSSDCPAETLGGINYDCNACERGNDAKRCKTLSEITGSIQCYDYSSETKPDFAKIEKVFCMDSCQYSLWTDKSDSNKKKHFLGCASDCDKFKAGNAGAACTECKSDEDCQKIFGGGGGGGGGGGDSTTKPKQGNKVTGSTYLIGSMAIVIYAVSQNMRQF